ncbi:MAG: hypothetical protein EXS69_01770 [Candidatus Zambryskibacteria bacterium]|nr:hypothetical protein [Candidatus Zambryskibacteria bacterium]
MNDLENQGFFRRNAVGLVVVLAVVVFGLLLSKGWDKILNKGIDSMSTVTGNFSCLPLKDGTIPKENCTLGVRSHDGSFYALDISRIQDANTDLKAEDTIAVTGFLLPQTQVAGSEWAIYNAKGIIKVNTLLRTR